MNISCGLMDFCQGLSNSSYTKVVEHIYSATKAGFKRVTKEEVDQEMEKNEHNVHLKNHLKVSGDVSWKKRGFTSLYGVTTLIGQYTGKVLDMVVKSSYCEACNAWESKKGTQEYDVWFESHEESC